MFHIRSRIAAAGPAPETGLDGNFRRDFANKVSVPAGCCRPAQRRDPARTNCHPPGNELDILTRESAVPAALPGIDTVWEQGYSGGRVGTKLDFARPNRPKLVVALLFSRRYSA